MVTPTSCLQTAHCDSLVSCEAIDSAGTSIFKRISRGEERGREGREGKRRESKGTEKGEEEVPEWITLGNGKLCPVQFSFSMYVCVCVYVLGPVIKCTLWVMVKEFERWPRASFLVGQ